MTGAPRILPLSRAVGRAKKAALSFSTVFRPLKGGNTFEAPVTFVTRAADKSL